MRTIDADLFSTSSEEDEESESVGRSQFIVDEAVEALEEVEDDFSPDYEESEEVRNEYSGGQDTTYVAASHSLNGAESATDTSFAEDFLELTKNYIENYNFDMIQRRRGSRWLWSIISQVMRQSPSWVDADIECCLLQIHR